MKVVQIIVVLVIGIAIGYGLIILQPMWSDSATGKTDDTASGSADDMSNTQNSYSSDPIPLSSIPLTDSQKKAAETFGIDVDTFVITPAMISCAEVKLGKDRVDAIIAGASPSMTESLSLMACLKAE